MSYKIIVLHQVHMATLVQDGGLLRHSYPENILLELYETVSNYFIS